MRCDYRLVVLGAGGTGKSSLLSRFLYGRFDTKYRPTVDDLTRKIIQLPNGDFHSVEFLDTAGLHQFPAMRRLFIMSGRAFIIVYSVDNPATFREALNLSDLVKDIKGHDQIPMILVGNKNDLVSTTTTSYSNNDNNGNQYDITTPNRNRKLVSTVEARNEATARNCAFIEASAKTDENVRELFTELMVKIFKVEPDMKVTPTTLGDKAQQGEGRRKKRSLHRRHRKQKDVVADSSAMAAAVVSPPAEKHVDKINGNDVTTGSSDTSRCSVM